MLWNVYSWLCFSTYTALFPGSLPTHESLRTRLVHTLYTALGRTLVGHDPYSSENLPAKLSWMQRHTLFSVVSQLLYKWRERLSVTNLSSENKFWLNAPVVNRAKVKKCEQTLLFIAMHYWGYMSLDVKGQWWLRFPLCLLITVVQQPGTSSPPSWLSASLKVSYGCAGPLSPTAPVVFSQWIGSSMYAPLQLTSPSSTSCRHLGVLTVSSPVSV